MDYVVDHIPEASQQTADLWAHRDGDGLVLEVKSRIEDCAIAEELEAAPIGAIVEYEGKVERDDTIGRIVRKAVGQIQASQRLYDGLGVLWFRPDPIFRGLDAAEKMWATLVGARIIGYGPRLEDFKFGTCLFATHSSFHRHKSLDATVINADEQATCAFWQSGDGPRCCGASARDVRPKF
jgi:ketosteroid isomerase-like protein